MAPFRHMPGNAEPPTAYQWRSDPRRLRQTRACLDCKLSRRLCRFLSALGFLFLREKLSQNAEGGLLPIFACATDGADARRATFIARAENQQFARIAQQLSSHLVERCALPDAAGVVVVNIQVRFKNSGRSLGPQRHAEIAR